MHYLKNTLFFLFISLFTFSSCSKDDEAPSTTNLIQQGKWKVSLFVKNGTNKAGDYFIGYEFSFADNGVVTGNKTGASAVTGSWALTTNDEVSNLRLNFGSMALFNELNDEWKVVEKSSTSIRLEHTGSGNAGTNLLTLEKI